MTGQVPIVTTKETTCRCLHSRPFSRYFADKRDVLFAGSERLPGVISPAVLGTDPGLAPAQALIAGLASTGTTLAEHVPRSPERRRIVAGSPELQERERTKLAAVTDALVQALCSRGASEAAAQLLADVGLAVFRAAFARWTEEPDGPEFPVYIQQAAAELTDALAPISGRNAGAAL